MAKKRHYAKNAGDPKRFNERFAKGGSSRHGYHTATEKDTTAYGEINSGTGYGSMIHTEDNQMSGLPLDVKMLDYPKNGSFMPYGLEWGYHSEDKQMSGDRDKIRRQVSPRKA